MSVIVSGAFDNMMARDIRYLHEVARSGSVQIQLWSDALIEKLIGNTPKFPAAERRYFLESLRHVERVDVVDGQSSTPNLFIDEGKLSGFPSHELSESQQMWTLPTTQKKVVVTGCYDWFHSGHVRFFEEVSELGDLYVVVGSDANIELLKGKGHPLFPALQRQYVVGSVRFVKQALISTGMGWMDAEPEFAQIKPDIYAVNEDGDKPDKRAWCEKNGVTYRVLKRLPKSGLPRRESTALRGF